MRGRRFQVDRDTGDDGRFRVADTVRFTDAASDPRWESVLVSYFPMRETEDGVVVTGDRSRTQVSAESATTVEIDHLVDAVSVTPPGAHEAEHRNVWRARITPVSADETLRLVVEPKPQ